ncbi:MAG: hypothetical protein CBC13_04145 [Planctomycetia bacterium TMED53]|nr:MAG: hypothetical protein CBC13_04145 [Planctomycetia bacterium TMED53]
MRGEIPKYGLDLKTARTGQILESPYEITVDDSWRCQWQSVFPTASKLTTSREYAKACGFNAIPIPQAMLLNMTLCFSVEPFSQSCRLHLGLENARQELPASFGDTFRSFTKIESLANTSRGDASVIHTTHILVNQRDERVFSLKKRSYYEPLPNNDVIEPIQESDGMASHFETPTKSLIDHYDGIKEFPSAQIEPLKAGRLIIHPMVRPLGWSENLALSTTYRNTHPIHWDSTSYGRDGIVVCGGFVQSLVFATGDREIRQVLDETLIHSSHINTVTPEDGIGSISKILEIENISDRLERVTLKTLGLKNVDVSKELSSLEIPNKLLNSDPLKPSEIELTCSDQCPELAGKIAMQATRSILRPRY